ncbi:MAG: hypothetical protein AB1505_16705 [Candidatus Latescibacterota bacterium]
MSGDSAEALTWRVHPLGQEPRPKSAALIVLLVGLAAAAGNAFGGTAYGLTALAVLAASLSRYWLPTRYRLDGVGVQTEHLGWRRARSWREFRRVDVHRNGVFLSPFPQPSRLDPFRGCFLACGAERAAVAAWARAQVALAGRLHCGPVQGGDQRHG